MNLRLLFEIAVFFVVLLLGHTSIEFKCGKSSIGCGCGIEDVAIGPEQHQYEFGPAVPYSWLTLVSLYRRLNDSSESVNYLCTGTIVTESLILTSTRCVEHVKLSDLVSGSVFIMLDHLTGSKFHRNIYKIDRIHTESIRSANSDHRSTNRLSLLHLSDPLELLMKKHLSPVCIGSTFNSFDEYNYTNSINKSSVVMIAGWPKTSEDEPSKSHSVQQKLIDSDGFNHEYCKRMIENPDIHFCFITSVDKRDQDLPVFRWSNDHWTQIGIVTSVRQIEDKTQQINIVTTLFHHQLWIRSIIQAYEKRELHKSDLESHQLREKHRYPMHYKCFRPTTPCGCSYSEVKLNSAETSSGEEAVGNSWSMVVSIRMNNSQQHICSGSVLTSFHVLTAAHCVDKLIEKHLNDLTVIGGIHGLFDGGVDVFEVNRIILHPGWNRNANNDHNDLAILHLSSSMNVDNDPFLRRSCIPSNISQENLTQYPKINTSLAVMGWGAMGPHANITDKMQQSEVFVVDRRHPNCSLNTDSEKLQFCAGLNEGARDACAGDEGGPILEWKGKSWEQVGITIRRSRCKNTDGPGLYTRLANYVGWLREVTGESLTTTLSTPITNPPITYACNPSLTCGCSYNNVELSPSSRIINGYDAIPHSWSMVVSLRRMDDNEHICGGSVLNDYFILTAAHCVVRRPTTRPTGVFVAAGSYRQSEFTETPNEVSQIFIHHEWVPGPLGNWNDLALLKLSRPLNISKNPYITRTCLQRINRSVNMLTYPEAATPMAVMGWGVLDELSSHTPNDLQQVELLVLNKSEESCSNYIKDKAKQFCAGIPEKGGQDTCRGDSGGPILQWLGNRWEQVGLVSYGLVCGSPRTPTVFTQVANYVDWIEEILLKETPTSSYSSRNFPYHMLLILITSRMIFIHA